LENSYSMESSISTTHNDSAPFAFDEVEEGSYDDLDELLDTNDGTGGGDEIEGSDVEKILLGVASSLHPTVLPSDNATSILEHPNDEVIPMLSNDNGNQKLKSMASSSPIQAIQGVNSSGDGSTSAYVTSMSPTTLLNNLLDVDSDEVSENGDDNIIADFREASSLSVDEMYVNAKMDMSIKTEASLVSDTRKGSEFLDTMFDTMVNISSDNDDDGTSSFVTAQEDGDASLTIYSKESTVSTEAVENKNTSNETASNHNDLIFCQRTEATNGVNFDSDIASKLNQPIVGSVSFHESIDKKYESTSAPLWDDDPSTPKRSGREINLLIGASSPLKSGIAQENSDNKAHRPEGISHQNPNDSTSLQCNDITSAMGNVQSECENSATTAVLPPLNNVHTDSTGQRGLTIDRLSVPSLSDDNTAVGTGLKYDQPVSQTTAEIDHVDLNISSDQLHTTAIAPTDLGSTIKILDHQENISKPEVDMSVTSKLISQDLDQDSEPLNSKKGNVGGSDLSIVSAQSVKTLNDFKFSTKPQLCSEVKSLHVEFTSLLKKGQKKSDVSLSSASSTISHGSFNKARMTSGLFASGPTDEQQHRRHKSDDLLPPRSPKKGSTSTGPQGLSSSVISNLLPQSIGDNEDDTEVVETKWIKQSHAVSFNPRRSIFPLNHDSKDKLQSISPPGSPPEPCYSGTETDEGTSFNDETRSSSSSDCRIYSAPGLWDMIGDCDSLADRALAETFKDVESESGIPIKLQRSESLAGSSTSPSEAEKSMNRNVAAKPSFKSDASLSSSGIKLLGPNRQLSFSQHSKGSFSSARSTLEKKDKRPLLTPINTRRSTIYEPRRVESDVSSLDRFSSIKIHSPERAYTVSMHCSSPDLRNMIEESPSSCQALPIATATSTIMKSLTFQQGGRLISEGKYQDDELSPEPVVLKHSLHEKSEEKLDGSEVHLQGLVQEFTNIRPLDTPLGDIELSFTLKNMGTLWWRQFVANTKHSKIFQDMISGTPHTPTNEKGCRNDVITKRSRCASSGVAETMVCDNIELHGVSLLQKGEKPTTKGSQQQQSKCRRLVLSTFITEIKSGHFETSDQELRHQVPTTGNNEVNLDLLHEAGQQNVTVVTTLIKDVIAFASISNPSHSDCDSIIYSVTVKDRMAIEKKAKMKYEGDILRVKDVLRAQITFRNDQELICALVRLLQIAKPASIDDTSQGDKIKLIRIKNLFSINSVSLISRTPLPTGYRHVLLNLRLQNGMIFGKCLLINDNFWY
jgi:hypothetical protein